MFLFPVCLFIYLSALECFSGCCHIVIFAERESRKGFEVIVIQKKIKHTSLRYYFNLVKFVAKEGSSDYKKVRKRWFFD